MSESSVGTVLSVNVGRQRSNPVPGRVDTGIHKASVAGPVTVRAPGLRGDGAGSGFVGDYIGDDKHHGGDHQAVYAFAREELDHWATELNREIPPGLFGENLTTSGYDVDAAVLGEIWRIGNLRLQVTGGRTPCATFAGVMGEPGWVKTFAQRGRTGAYLMVLEPGAVSAGAEIVVESRPVHGITVSQAFRAGTTERALLPQLSDLGPYLLPELRAKAEKAAGRSR